MLVFAEWHDVAHRNAWRTLWLRFPNEDEWQSAMALRKKMADFQTKPDRARPKKTV